MQLCCPLMQIQLQDADTKAASSWEEPKQHEELCTRMVPAVHLCIALLISLRLTTDLVDPQLSRIHASVSLF